MAQISPRHSSMSSGVHIEDMAYYSTRNAHVILGSRFSFWLARTKEAEKLLRLRAQIVKITSNNLRSAFQQFDGLAVPVAGRVAIAELPLRHGKEEVVC